MPAICRPGTSCTRLAASCSPCRSICGVWRSRADRAHRRGRQTRSAGDHRRRAFQRLQHRVPRVRPRPGVDVRRSVRSRADRSKRGGSAAEASARPVPVPASVARRQADRLRQRRRQGRHHAGSTTWRARARRAGSRWEAAIVFPSGRRTASASRFSRTARAISASSGSAPTAPATAERLTKPDKDTAHVPESWSPDGKTLLFSVAKGSSYSLAALSLPDKKVTPVWRHPVGVSSRCDVFARRPMGGVLGGCARSRAAGSLFVQPFPTTGATYPISKGSGFHPTWSPDGKELFYLTGVGAAIRRGERHDAADLHLRQPGAGAETFRRARPRVRAKQRHHARRQAIPRRRRCRTERRVRRAGRSADSGRAQLVRGAEGARAGGKMIELGLPSTSPRPLQRELLHAPSGRRLADVEIALVSMLMPCGRRNCPTWRPPRPNSPTISRSDRRRIQTLWLVPSAT